MRSSFLRRKLRLVHRATTGSLSPLGAFGLVAITLFWPLIGNVSLACRVAMNAAAGVTPRPQPVIIAALGWSAWGVIVPLIVVVASAWPRLVSVRAITAHSIALAAAITFHGAISLSIQRAILGTTNLFDLRVLPEQLATIIVFGFLVYSSTVVAVAAISNARVRQEAAAEEERLREQLIGARLQLLKRRVQPRFFFRALETLAAAIERDRDEAEAIIASLSRFLRHALRQEESSIASFDEELDVLNDYVSVEEARAGRRIVMRAEIDGNSEPPHLPRALLTQLAEVVWPSIDAPESVTLSAFARGEADHVSVCVTGAHSDVADATRRLDTLRRYLQLSPEVEVDARLLERDTALELDLVVKRLAAAMEHGAA